ncbi:MAG: RNA polymerase sigma factor [Verrucomicrobia bacterium]|nr:RNA polymerase sigma factor [Verrucomicrobiota bacterium]MBU1735773.1 RNA polymerase sigma factor [Verrucomicrobiota bacterium]
MNQDKVKMFEELLIKHHKMALAYAYSLSENYHTAQEVAQESLMEAFKSFDNFDSMLGSFGSWIRGIIRNKYLERIRKNREIPLEQEIIDLIEREYENWDELGRNSGNDVFGILKKCLETLSLIHRRIVELFYYEKRKCAEIAESEHLSEPTVRKRLERIRGGLKACIDKKMTGAEEGVMEI